MRIRICGSICILESAKCFIFCCLCLVTVLFGLSQLRIDETLDKSLRQQELFENLKGVVKDESLKQAWEKLENEKEDLKLKEKDMEQKEIEITEKEANVKPCIKEEPKSIRMAMDAVKHKYNDVLKAQNYLLSHQDRPSDAHYHVNISLSDSISLDRIPPDTRPQACKAHKYDLSILPTASVVIPFFNEAVSILMRTVHSILNNSPDELLVEIILVDDNSTHSCVKDIMEDYLKVLPKTRVIRNKDREGLIRSRLNGYRIARGDVVIFLDGHSECNVGWLEPLLEEIRLHPNSLLQPFVDGIDDKKIKYEGRSKPPYLLGSVSWDLRYTWTHIVDHIAVQATEQGLPIHTPTLVGCALAVRRDYFKRIGEFDEDMQVWGGENLEISFRVWMCGGRVSTVLCSRVAHLFRGYPEKFKGIKGNPITKNLLRTAEVWMDNYRKYVYAAIGSRQGAEMTQSELVSLRQRRDLRKRLQCKSFEWYMQNVMPAFPSPEQDVIYHGEIFNDKTDACWVALDDDFIGITYECFVHRLLPKNFFSLTNTGLLKFKDRCVKISAPNPALRIVECPKPGDDLEGFSKWRFDTDNNYYGQIVAQQRNDNGDLAEFCMCQVTSVLPEHHHKQMPEIATCDPNEKLMSWHFTYRFNWDTVPQYVMENKYNY